MILRASSMASLMPLYREVCIRVLVGVGEKEITSGTWVEKVE